MIKLSRPVFEDGMDQLLTMFADKMSFEKRDLYYNVLKRKLSDKQFMFAVRHLLETHLYKSMPNPAHFIHAAEGCESDMLQGRTAEYYCERGYYNWGTSQESNDFKRARARAWHQAMVDGDWLPFRQICELQGYHIGAIKHEKTN